MYEFFSVITNIKNIRILNLCTFDTHQSHLLIINNNIIENDFARKI